MSLKTTQPYNHCGFKAKDGIGAAAPVNFEKQPVKNTNDHLIHSFCTLLLVKYRFYIQRHALLLVALEIKRSSRLTKFLLGNKQILQLQSYRNCLESKIVCMEMYKYKKVHLLHFSAFFSCGQSGLQVGQSLFHIIRIYDANLNELHCCALTNPLHI